MQKKKRGRKRSLLLINNDEVDKIYIVLITIHKTTLDSRILYTLVSHVDAVNILLL